MATLTEATLAEIEAVRARNNVAWMALLRLALRVAPEEARALLAEITANDQAVSRLLSSIAACPPGTGGGTPP